MPATRGRRDFTLRMRISTAKRTPKACPHRRDVAQLARCRVGRWLLALGWFAMDMDRRSHRAKTINIKTQPITMSRHVYRPITMALLAMPLIARAQTQPDPNAAAAARTSALQDQLQQERERALERDRQWQAPDVRLPVSSEPIPAVLPSEAPCFKLDTITLDVPATLPDRIKSFNDPASLHDAFS